MSRRSRLGTLKRPLRLIVRVLLSALLLIVTLYAAVLLYNGLHTRSRLHDAAARLEAVSVRVVQVSRADDSLLWYAVVLEETHDSAPPTNAERPAGQHSRFGTVYATTVNARLSVGQELTAYYDAAVGQLAVVDFEVADGMIRAGCCGLGLTALHLLILPVRLAVRLRRRRKHTAPVVVDRFS